LAGRETLRAPFCQRHGERANGWKILYYWSEKLSETGAGRSSNKLFCLAIGVFGAKSEDGQKIFVRIFSRHGESRKIGGSFGWAVSFVMPVIRKKKKGTGASPPCFKP